MNTNNISVKKKIIFLLIPIVAILLHLILSNILFDNAYYLCINIFKISEQQLIKFSYIVETTVSFILIIIFFIIYKLLFRDEDDNINVIFNKKDIFISIILGIGFSGAAYLWIRIAEHIHFFENSLKAMEKANESIESGSKLVLILLAVVTAPLIEEIIFRGIVFRSMRKVLSIPVSVIISALMFGIYHMNLTQAVYATFMGIIAALIYEKRRNLIYPILVHMANNLIGALQSFVTSKIGIEVFHMFTVIMIIPMIYIIYILMNGKKAIKISDENY